MMHRRPVVATTIRHLHLQLHFLLLLIFAVFGSSFPKTSRFFCPFGLLLQHETPKDDAEKAGAIHRRADVHQADDAEKGWLCRNA